MYSLYINSSDPRWLPFIKSDHKANIFHHPAWTNLITECYGYRPFVVAVGDSQSKIVAGIPMMEVKSWLTGHRLVSLPFTDHCIPLYSSDEARDYLAEVLANYYADRTISRLEVRWDFPIGESVRHDSPHVLHTLPLNLDSSLVFGRFHQMHQRNIKIAQKRGITIEKGTDLRHLRIFYELHCQTRRRQGTPVQSWTFFELLGKRLLAEGLGFVLLAYLEHDCIAGAVFLHWNRTLTYKYGASTVSGLKLRPNNLIFWQAIQWGCANGYTTLDMGRTDNSNEGLRAFKSGWGADEMPLVYSMLSVSPPGAKLNKLEPIMKAVIQNSPIWVSKLVGKALYGHFG